MPAFLVGIFRKKEYNCIVNMDVKKYLDTYLRVMNDMKKVLLITFALITGVALIACFINGKSLPFMSMQVVETEEPEKNDEMSEEELTKCLNELLADCKLKKSGESNYLLLMYAKLSCSFDDCVERKYEPIIHDELTKEEVRALVGNPVCETEDVWMFPDDELLLLFKDGKLYKLVYIGNFDGAGNMHEDRFFVREISDPLNLEEVRAAIQKVIQEEKEFRERRDAIFNSDEELVKLCQLPQNEFWRLLGDYDIPSETNLFPVFGFETEKRIVYFQYSPEGTLIICSREDKETQERKRVYVDMEYPLNMKIYELLQQANEENAG